MIFNHPNHIRATFTLPVFSASGRFSTRVLAATQKPQTATRQHRPKCIFFVHLLIFSGNVFRNVRKCSSRTLIHPPTPTPPDDHTTACATCTCSVTSEKCSSRTLIHTPPHPPDDHTTACATCTCAVTSEKCSSRTLIHTPPHPP